MAPKDNPLFGRDLITANDFTVPEWQLVLDTAAEMKRRLDAHDFTWLESTMAHQTAALVFEEPSTRTYGSTFAAMLKLGGSVIPFVGAAEMSSLAKNESFPDMGRTLTEIGVSVIAIRHRKSGSAQALAEGADVPVINCGDGTGNHPTQAGLDLMTARQYLDLPNSTVTLLGDLKHGRTVHSNGPLFARFGVRRFFLVSPESLCMPEEIVTMMRYHDAEVIISSDVEEALSQSTLVYVTRIQGERFDDPAEYAAVRGAYVVERALLERTNPEIYVMHPLPRVDELDPDIDPMLNALYWVQVRNGLYLRMALLALLLGVTPEF